MITHGFGVYFRLYLRSCGCRWREYVGALQWSFRVLSRLGGKSKGDEGAGQLLQLVIGWRIGDTDRRRRLEMTIEED